MFEKCTKIEGWIALAATHELLLIPMKVWSKSFVTFLSSPSGQLLVLNWWKIFIFQREKENNIGYIDVNLKRVGKWREDPWKWDFVSSIGFVLSILVHFKIISSLYLKAFPPREDGFSIEGIFCHSIFFIKKFRQRKALLPQPPTPKGFL